MQPSSAPATPTIAENNNQNLLNLGIHIYRKKITYNSISFLDEPSSHSSPTIPPSNILDPLHELFPPTSVNKIETNPEIPSINQELASAFSSSNDISTHTSGMMSNEKIMALFNTPQTSTINIRPASNRM